MTTQYELLYIVPTSFTDEEAGAVETTVAGILAKHGATVDDTRRLGKFKLAYPIKKQRHGHYVLVRFTAEGKNMVKIDTELRITPSVLRHLILRAEEAGDTKYDLVQFVEVTVEGKEERRRAGKTAGKEGEKDGEEVKAGVAALEEKKEGDLAASTMTSDEVEKKIESALKDDAQAV